MYEWHLIWFDLIGFDHLGFMFTVDQVWQCNKRVHVQTDVRPQHYCVANVPFPKKKKCLSSSTHNNLKLVHKCYTSFCNDLVYYWTYIFCDWIIVCWKFFSILPIDQFLMFLFLFHFKFYRFSTQKRICNCIHKSICVKRNHTNVHNVRNHLPIHPIFRNIREFILELSHIVARYVNANLPNYPIFNNTFVLIRAINRTNVVFPIVRKHLANCPICNHIHVLIKRINHSNVTVVINVLRMKLACWTIFPNIRNRNIWRRTFVNFVANRTHKKRI